MDHHHCHRHGEVTAELAVHGSAAMSKHVVACTVPHSQPQSLLGLGLLVSFSLGVLGVWSSQAVLVAHDGMYHPAPGRHSCVSICVLENLPLHCSRMWAHPILILTIIIGPVVGGRCKNSLSWKVMGSPPRVLLGVKYSSAGPPLPPV